MIKAVWNGTVVAESERTEIVEGNHYFPPEALHTELFRSSDKKTVCPWKGIAHYYSLTVDGQSNVDAAWYYPSPNPEAKRIAGMVAFWKGVRIEK